MANTMKAKIELMLKNAATQRNKAEKDGRNDAMQFWFGRMTAAKEILVAIENAKHIRG